RCLQQRNEIMKSFFVAVNNLSKNFFSSTRCQLPQLPVDSYHPSTGEPLHTCFSAASTTPLSLSRLRCVVQRGANTKALMCAWQVFFEQTRNILWPPPLIKKRPPAQP
ncbi:hypothetical protein AB6Q13_23115, partial [Ralstonia solanacearum]|uniref:hypothetical protein n=1 Tax=Ralstonia solanacearum TaxID=305 RepID=UPI0023061002